MLELWEHIEELTLGNRLPCVVGGDFNVILSEEEKLGGLDLLNMKQLILRHVFVIVLSLI